VNRQQVEPTGEGRFEEASQDVVLYPGGDDSQFGFVVATGPVSVAPAGLVDAEEVAFSTHQDHVRGADKSGWVVRFVLFWLSLN
jgi:hypothetical protein